MEYSDLINKNRLNKLPVHKTPAGVWERLETSMFSLNISSLPVYAPPAGAWGGISRSLLARKRARVAAIIFLLFIGLGTASYFTHEAFIATSNEQPATSNQQPETRSQPPATSSQQPATRNQQPVARNQQPETRITLKPANLLYASIEHEKRLDMNTTYRNDECSNFSGPGIDFSWGPWYEYRVFLSGDEYLQSEQLAWHSAGLDARFSFRHVYIESGLGMSFTRDRNTWSYDYLREELINTYEYVDSVSYDPVTGEIIHYTTTIEIYDSVPHSSIKTSTSSYIYLQMPLRFGLKLINKRDFCSSISGGITYGFLISKNENSVSPVEADSRILHIYHEPVTRTDHLFTAGLRLEFEWKLSDRMGLYAWPAAYYSLNQLYKNREGSNPISLGIGAGLRIK